MLFTWSTSKDTLPQTPYKAILVPLNTRCVRSVIAKIIATQSKQVIWTPHVLRVSRFNLIQSVNDNDDICTILRTEMLYILYVICSINKRLVRCSSYSCKCTKKTNTDFLKRLRRMYFFFRRYYMYVICSINKRL